MPRTIHIIGAGLAGLSAAIRLTGRGEAVVLHEATDVVGGRCRSYHDAAIGMTIDNGNHLLLSANHAALGYLRVLGAEQRLVGPAEAEFAFVDYRSRARWTLRINDGPVPWWIFDRQRRVPGTRAFDYLRIAPLLLTGSSQSVGDVVECKGPVYERLLQPVLLAALNIDPAEGSAALASAVLTETLAVGGKACRPLIARDGLGSTMIEPALDYLKQHGTPVQLSHQLHAIRFGRERAEALDFGKESIPLAADDAVIVAVPPYAAQGLIPQLQAPTEFRAIVNGHFRIDPAPGQQSILGVLNATTEWIFAFPGRVSVTISAGDRLLKTPREQLAERIWAEVAAITGLPPTLPPWQIVRERRATFAATAAQDAKRPSAPTAWRNLFLAGDWTNTGLPATIEGAIRSGNRAADLVAQL